MAIIGVLTNPNSGKNRGHRSRRLELERVVGRFGIVRQTQSVEELETVVDEFLDAGCEYWVCDGGDGTLHWLLSVGHRRVQQRAVRARAVGDALAHGASLPKIAPANGGSIDFVAHKARVRGGAPEIVRALVEHVRVGSCPAVVPLDTLHIAGEPVAGGAALDQVGFAAAIGGVAQRFFDKLYQHKPVQAWRIVDVLARSAAGGMASSAPRSLRPMLAPSLQSYAADVFEPTRARVDVDGRPLDFDRFSSLQVGSIDISLGGVVRTFRHAAAPGILHAQAICTSRLGVVANLPNIVMGTPIWGKHVYDGPARELSATALPGHQLDPVIDGEVFRGLERIRVTRGPRLEIPAVCTG
jgi:diacylglycerol kinase family enzyme